MKGIKFLIAGATCLLSAVLISVAMKAFRDKMIIALGVITTNNISGVLVGTVIVLGLASLAWGLFLLVPTLLKNSSEGKLRRISMAYRAKRSGLKEVREQLKVQKETRPRLAPELDLCLAQLDDMSSLFKRFDQLIETNEAQTVSSARVGLEEIERTICANFKRVINSIIAAEVDDTPETQVFYRQCVDRINMVIDANAKAIDKGNQFLLELADNISEWAGDTTLLDAWIDTIRSQNKQSAIGRW